MNRVIVVGGGPAGMSAALAAAEHGSEVTIIESRTELGGQYWRSKTGQAITGRDGKRGESLRHAVVENQSIKILISTSVWNVTAKADGIVVRVTSGTTETEISCDRLIVASGAHDRVLPFPGWTNPGVMAAGGVQALLKGQGVLAGRRAVLIGTGPFLLTVALGLREAGAEVTLIEANSMIRWAKHPWVLLTNPKKIIDALYYQRRLIGVRKLRDDIQSVSSDLMVKLTRNQVQADVVGVGYGFTPDLSVLLSLGAKTTIDDGNLVVEVDEHQKTSVDGVYAAGEVTGIGGVEASLVEGRIAGLSSVGAKIPRRLERQRAHWKRFSAALADVYRRPEWVSKLTSDTVICRCEEVTVAKIDQTLNELGATDPRSVKLFARSGMGLCQGRFCSQAVAAVVASRGGASDILSQRPIVTPVPLGLIAQSTPETDGQK